MGMQCALYAASEAAARQALEDPEALSDIFRGDPLSKRAVRLEKSWHGLHFVFTGSAWEGDEPLNFLLGGGEPVGEAGDEEEAPARVLLPDFVRKLKKALDGISRDEFERRFDLEKLEEAEIYPEIWDEELSDLLEEYRMYFDNLKAFVDAVAERGDAILVMLG